MVLPLPAIHYPVAFVEERELLPLKLNGHCPRDIFHMPRTWSWLELTDSCPLMLSSSKSLLLLLQKSKEHVAALDANPPPPRPHPQWRSGGNSVGSPDKLYSGKKEDNISVEENSPSRGHSRRRG